MVYLSDGEDSIIRRPWLAGGCWAMEKKIVSSVTDRNYQKAKITETPEYV